MKKIIKKLLKKFEKIKHQKILKNNTIVEILKKKNNFNKNLPCEKCTNETIKKRNYEKLGHFVFLRILSRFLWLNEHFSQFFGIFEKKSNSTVSPGFFHKGSIWLLSSKAKVQ